jgi:hypothetical protein
MERTWKPKAAGVLSIISGAIEIILGALVLFFGSILSSLGGSWQNWLGDWGGMSDFGALPAMPDIGGIISAAAVVIGIVLIIIGVIAVVGGVHSIKRRHWGLALAGAILSFPFLPLGGILGLLAIIFVSLGKREFE